MSDYRIEAASREEWAERALRAEAERDMFREALDRSATASKYFAHSDQVSEDAVRYAHETTQRLALDALKTSPGSDE